MDEEVAVEEPQSMVEDGPPCSCSVSEISLDVHCEVESNKRKNIF